MKCDMMLAVHDLSAVATYAKTVEEMGFDGLWSTESRYNPFLPLAVASTVTNTLTLGTAIAVAFPRSPTLLAHAAWDLQASSQGRFILGLGTQVKGHNVRRFGVPWESPGKKLREVILALRAIWDCWQHGTPLNFQGEFYHLTLMTPAFSPPPIDHPHIPIYIAAVNPYMCRLAGELCQGLHVHPLHSVQYLTETVLPNLERGAAKAGRQRQDLVLFASPFVVTGETEEEMAAMRNRVRQQIAFYASTRTYRVVLETHGWGEVSPILNKKAAGGDWQGMAQEITDEMLETFAVVAPLDELPDRLRARYAGGLLDRFAVYHPHQPGGDQERWRRLAQAFRS